MAGRKQRIVTTAQKFIFNPLTRAYSGFVPGTALLETIGRSSSLPRYTPINAVRRDDTIWFASEFGRRSDYIKNLQANPQVRARFQGRWLEGIACISEDPGPMSRAHRMGIRVMGTQALPVRIDLKPEAPPEVRA